MGGRKAGRWAALEFGRARVNAAWKEEREALNVIRWERLKGFLCRNGGHPKMPAVQEAKLARLTSVPPELPSASHR